MQQLKWISVLMLVVGCYFVSGMFFQIIQKPKTESVGISAQDFGAEYNDDDSADEAYDLHEEEFELARGDEDIEIPVNEELKTQIKQVIKDEDFTEQVSFDPQDDDNDEESDEEEEPMEVVIRQALKDLKGTAALSTEQQQSLQRLAMQIDRTLEDAPVMDASEDIGNGRHLSSDQLAEAESDLMDEETPDEEGDQFE